MNRTTIQIATLAGFVIALTIPPVLPLLCKLTKNGCRSVKTGPI